MRQGIIPALAGNTKTPTFFKSACRDHPRACGEHVEELDRFMSQQGSSPRLRGTLLIAFLGIMLFGIIPALAGNTRYCRQYMATVGDHPRACGEHATDANAMLPIKGSSPRLRGTRALLAMSVNRVGIIPALAGNTVDVHRSSLMMRDHPRACGEHHWALRSRSPWTGSSPRLRGTPRRPPVVRQIRGIIPALAGNTMRACSPANSARDHPRACGEHLAEWQADMRSRGSSPRLRGTPVAWRVVPIRRGIIPALAGNTLARTFTKR